MDLNVPPHGGSGVAVDVRALGLARTDRPKLNFSVQQCAAPNQARVRLSIPLDAGQPDEAEALATLAEDGKLDVAYDATIDLEVQRRALSEELARLYAGKGNLLSRELKLERDNLLELLLPLATLGRSILNSLVFGATLRGFGADPAYRAMVHRAVVSALSRPQRIEVGESSARLFPWALLFHDVPVRLQSTNRSTLDPGRFWGFMHEIQEKPPGTSVRRDLPDPPVIASSVCSDVDARGWHTRRKHPFYCRQAEQRHFTIKRLDDIDALGEELVNFQADCLYFFGHAHDELAASRSGIELRKRTLTVDKLRNELKAPSFSHDPVVVFLNGCHTASIQGWNVESFLGMLASEKVDRVCFLGSIAGIPPEFAKWFATYFWVDFLLQRLPIGPALLRARRAMLRRWNNPLGLLYTVLGRTDTRFMEPPRAPS